MHRCITRTGAESNQVGYAAGSVHSVVGGGIGMNRAARNTARIPSQPRRKAPEDWRTPKRWLDHEAATLARQRLGVRQSSLLFIRIAAPSP